MPQRLFTRIIMRAKVVCTLTPQLSLPRRPTSSRRAERRRICGPFTVLPHGAVIGGAEAPRQRRAQRAEGKRLRGVAPVMALKEAAPERDAISSLSIMCKRARNSWSAFVRA